MSVAFDPANPPDPRDEEMEWVTRYAINFTRDFVRGALRYNNSNMLREMGAVAFAPAVFFKTLFADGPKAYRAYKVSQLEK